MEYHINPVTNRVNRCVAVHKCDVDSPHFASKKKAVTALHSGIMPEISVPPVKTKYELDKEEVFLDLNEWDGFTAKGLLETLKISSEHVLNCEKRGFFTIKLKVPGYFVTEISTDLVRRTLKMKPRRKTASDNTELRLAELEVIDAKIARDRPKTLAEAWATSHILPAAQKRYWKLVDEHNEANPRPPWWSIEE